MVDGLAVDIDVESGDVSEVEFLFIKEDSGYFLLDGIFAHYFEKNGAIPVQNGIGFASCLCGHLSKADVVFIFAGDRAEDFVTSAVIVIFTHFAFLNHGPNGL